MLSSAVAVLRGLVVVFMTAATVLMPFSHEKEQKITRKNENCRASFAAISDTHLKDNFIRLGMLEFGLRDMEKAKDRLDAVVFNGDITDHGYPEQWQGFTDTLLKYDISGNNIMVIGNHDTWGKDDDYEYTRKNFVKYSKEATGRKISNVYFTTKINGYPVIVLGSEADHTYATISKKQINWFAAEMKKASKTGLPIFVFCHQSFNGTHGLPYNWELDKNEDDPTTGGIGDASDDILRIVKKYKNVFFISGHIHAGMTVEGSDKTFYSSVEKHGNYTLVNLPCYEYPDVRRGGHISNGTGYVFEMYDGEVLLRARNFASGTWLEKYDVTVKLAK
ncbi:MAG: metallophosphoesterase [Clostridia bacterium]|nr:metallophosphoesterase [Clostridia bacterium]